MPSVPLQTRLNSSPPSTGPSAAFQFQHLTLGQRPVRPVRSFLSLGKQGGSTLPPTVLPDLGWRKDYDSVCSHSGRVLGRGSTGVCYEGTHVPSGERVAIKIMPKLMGALPKGSRLGVIAKEARHLDTLEPCRSVVRLEECFEGDSHAALVMELCSGGDLESYVISHGPLDECGLALVASEVISMLNACHHAGIVHGDVKPANFCLKDVKNPLSEQDVDPAAEPWLKAIDFGSSAELADSTTRLHDWVGTPVFMAPEVYAHDYGPQADMWSAGVMLYWLFAKRYPFFPGSESDVEDIAVAVNQAPMDFDYAPWLGMSSQGKDFVQRCLQRDEKQRMTAEEALEHPWLSIALSSALIEGGQKELPYNPLGNIV